MKKSVSVYLSVFVILGITFFFIRSAYREWSEYSSLTRRSDHVLTTFEDLGRKVSNAAVMNPQLSTVKQPETSSLFSVDKTSLLADLAKLQNLVKDSVNIRIAGQINGKLRPEIDWIFKSNVPDSILHRRAEKHITILEEVNQLIQSGVTRTKFLVDHRQHRLLQSFNRLVLMALVFLVTTLVLLIYTVKGFLKQRKATKMREGQLRMSELRYKNIADTIHESLIIEDLEGKLIYANAEFIKTFGYSAEEFSALSLKDYTSEESYQEIMNRHTRRLQGEPVEDEFIYKAKRKDGSEIWIEARVALLIEDGKIIGTQSLERDITERVKAEEKEKKTSRMYAFLSAINKSIVQCGSENELLDTACDIATRVGNFKLAYIGILEGEHQLKIRSLTGDKAAIDKVLTVTELDMNDASYKHVPTMIALRSGKINYHNDVQNDPAFESRKNDFIQLGIHASISLPIFKFGKTIGVIGLHAGTRDFFDEEEVALLDEAAGDISFALENFEKAKQHKIAEELTIQSEKRFRQTLENMFEGVQIIGFDWRYLYVNEALTKYSSYQRKEMIGHSVMDLYPGVEQTALYAALKKCMNERLGSHLESEFVFPDGSKRDFELSIQPSPEGIFILSVDITVRKKSELEIIKLNRLYAFLSAINQSIVHLKTEHEVLKKACDIAVETGGFQLARVEMIDQNKKLHPVAISGGEHTKREINILAGIDYTDALTRETPVGKTLLSGSFEFNNDMRNDPALAGLKEALERADICSVISLPIKRAGEMIGVFILSSAQQDFFDKQEIALLVEAAGDLSFALENFENNRIYKETEDLLQKSERRFRGIIEKSADFKTLTDKTGRITYGSPSLLRFFGYTPEELLNKEAMSFFHPDEMDELIKKRNEILNQPGASYKFQNRIGHKNGSWIWCEGTVNNFLDDPAILGLVSNFRDITKIKIAEQQKEFDNQNLDALINNTRDLLWSIDKDFKFITFNQPFAEVMKTTTGKVIAKGDDVFSKAMSREQEQRFLKYYSRAFEGETFTITDVETSPTKYAAEISFYPIRQAGEIIGTACYSRDVSERLKQEKEREYMITQLTEKNHNLRQFAYITSHNLRGPIANLLGLTNLLDTFKIKDETLLQIINGVKVATAMFDETIKDLALALSLRDNPAIQIEIVDFGDIFEKVKTLSEISLRDCEAELDIDFTGAPKITFNRYYLESILINLLTNAIKYKDDSRRLKISLKSWTEGDHTLLSFSDNGIGFDSEVQKEKLFQLYQRFHIHKEGKGLGLFLIKSQLDALGGSIKVQSKPGWGTIFTIVFASNK